MYNIFFPLKFGFFAVLKSFEILEMLRNLRVTFGGLRLSQFVNSLTADHYFWCSGGVPGCFEGVPEYYGMFQGCSGVVPGCSRGCSGDVPRMFRGCPGGVPGCSGGVPGFTDTRFLVLRKFRRSRLFQGHSFVLCVSNKTANNNEPKTRLKRPRIAPKLHTRHKNNPMSSQVKFISTFITLF